jgi:mannosyl-glycoprotein endo-beta-N-acetylglucosaminidase
MLLVVIGLDLCTELFSSIESVQCAVSSLVNIALDHDLDGWLINIENTLPLECLSNVLLFLQLLTKEMHDACGTFSQVIWYDSVTTEGKLQWQDGLTTLNKPFFDACDAIFVNYTWKEQSLIQTRSLLGDNDRGTDVYYGVDVFGRGTIGGGGYNCCEALNYLSPHTYEDMDPSGEEESTQSSQHVCGYSAALFAPGWLLETQCSSVPATHSPWQK